MAIDRKKIFNILMVVLLLLSVGSLMWGVLQLINGVEGGGSYVRTGAILTLLCTIWMVVGNLKKKEEE